MEWLVRYDTKHAEIWQRKYIIGLFRIPWRHHPPTDMMVRKHASKGSPIDVAVKYITDKDARACITFREIGRAAPPGGIPWIKNLRS